VIGVCVAVWGVRAAKRLRARIGGDEVSQAINVGGAIWAGEQAIVGIDREGCETFTPFLPWLMRLRAARPA
jgi:hypothetical protein